MDIETLVGAPFLVDSFQSGGAVADRRAWTIESSLMSVMNPQRAAQRRFDRGFQW